MDDLEALVERLRQLVRRMKDGPKTTGAAIARAMGVEAVRVPEVVLKRARFLTLTAEELGWSEGHASTYFRTYFQPEARMAGAADGPALGAPDASSGPAVAPFPVDSVRETLRASADAAVDWYLTRSVPVSKARFLSHSGIADAGRGAVYSYHAAGEDGDVAIYVGITGYRVKSRLYTPTSPHARSTWWGDWSYMRFVPVEAAGDRQVLELLLITGLGPLANRKPSAIDVDAFLHD